MTKDEALKLAQRALSNKSANPETIYAALAAIEEVSAQQEHPEQMARLGWQYFECPACGSEGARAFPKPEQEPVGWLYQAGLDALKAGKCWTVYGTKQDEFYSTPIYLHPLPKQEPVAWLLETTQSLAKTLAREFYPEVTQWKCLDDLAGVISQIDNMTTGLVRKTEQEAVAWGIVASNTGRICQVTLNADDVAAHKPAHIKALYTSPPQRQPLTDEEIWQTVNDCTFADDLHADKFARAIEAKHGIKEIK